MQEKLIELTLAAVWSCIDAGRRRFLSAAVSVGFSLTLPLDSRSIGDFLANANAYRK